MGVLCRAFLFGFLSSSWIGERTLLPRLPIEANELLCRILCEWTENLPSRFLLLLLLFFVLMWSLSRYSKSSTSIFGPIVGPCSCTLLCASFSKLGTIPYEAGFESAFGPQVAKGNNIRFLFFFRILKSHFEKDIVLFGCDSLIYRLAKRVKVLTILSVFSLRLDDDGVRLERHQATVWEIEVFALWLFSLRHGGYDLGILEGSLHLSQHFKRLRLLNFFFLLLCNVFCQFKLQLCFEHLYISHIGVYAPSWRWVKNLFHLNWIDHEVRGVWRILPLLLCLFNWR